jgi:hypothetical protein
VAVLPGEIVVVRWRRADVAMGRVALREVVIDHRTERRKYDRDRQKKRPQ